MVVTDQFSVAFLNENWKDDDRINVVIFTIFLVKARFLVF